MIEQTINTQGSLTSLVGEGDGSKKSAKGGLFSKLMASFQKHIKQGEESLKVGVKDAKGLAALTVNIEDAALAKAGKTVQLGLAGKVEKAIKADSQVMVKSEGEAGSLAKSLLIGSNAQAMGAQSVESESTKLLALQKAQVEAKGQVEVLVGLGEAVQAQGLQTADPKVAQLALQKGLQKGLEDGSQKNLLAGGQAKSETDDKAQKFVASGAQGNVIGQATKQLAGQGDKAAVVEQGKFSLQGLTETDDTSKLSKSQLADIQAQAKKSAAGLAKNTDSSDDGVDAASVLRKSAQSNASQDDGVMLEASKLEAAKQNVAAASKEKGVFQPVTANQVGGASAAGQVQNQVGVGVAEAGIKTAQTKNNSNMSDGERGTGRSAAEMMQLDTSVTTETRTTRSEFAAQLAYRSAPAFKPNDAMIEISKAARDGSMKLEMQLEPANLGKIQVSMQMDAAKQIQVHLVVDQNSSRQVMEQQLPQLRQALADQGLSLAGFTMDMNSQQQQQQQGDGSPKGMNFAGMENGAGGMVMPQDSSVSLGVNMANDGRLNILA